MTNKYLEQLFISKVRIKALRYFFMHQDVEIHLRAAVRELNEEINAVRRELARMEKIGLVKVEQRGNRKYFKLNPEFVFFEELLGIVFKSFGLGAEIINNNKKLGNITFAVLTQAFTRGIAIGKHRVDLVIVADSIKLEELKHMVEKEEQRLGRDVYYAVLTNNDFEVRVKRRDQFVQELFEQNLITLIGDKAQLLVHH